MGRRGAAGVKWGVESRHRGGNLGHHVSLGLLLPLLPHDHPRLVPVVQLRGPLPRRGNTRVVWHQCMISDLLL